MARSLQFDRHLTATLDEVVAAKVPLANLYSYVPKSGLDDGNLKEAIDEKMDRAASPYDSHSPPADRIARVMAIGADGPAPTEQDEREAWTLLSGRELIEREMTEAVRARLARRGIRVQPAAAA